jgi:hypothetical protein
MGWSALAVFLMLAGASVFVLADHQAFTTTATTAAAGAVLVEVVGLTVAVWRLVLGEGPIPLAPVIRDAEHHRR